MWTVQEHPYYITIQHDGWEFVTITRRGTDERQWQDERDVAEAILILLQERLPDGPR